MNKLLIQPFKLATYYDKSYIIKNPRFHRYELINEYQLELLESLRNGSSIVSLLFPKVGVATVRHFQNCIALIRSLQSLHLLKVNYDESVLKDDPTRTTQVTMDISTISHSMADKLMQVGGRIVSYIPAPILFILSPVSVLVTMFFFSSMISKMSGTLGLLSSALILYFGVSLSLILRQFIRAGYLYKYMRSPFSVRFSFLAIFPTISLDTSDVWMEGYNSRLRLALVSLFSPFFVSFAVTLLGLASLLPFDVVVLLCGTSIIAFLLNLFPMFKEDGSELIHLLTIGKKGSKLKNEIASSIRELISRASTTSVFISSSTVWSMLSVIAWMLLWVGFLHEARVLVQDNFSASNPSTATFLSSLTAIAALTAAFYVLYLYVKTFFNKSRKKQFSELFAKGEVIKGLNKVPLFSEMNTEDKNYIVENINTHFYRRSESIFKQGDKGSDLFIILSGRVKVFFKSNDGKEKDMGYLFAGDTFGEISLLENIPRTVSTIAMEDSFIVSVPRDVLYDRILNKVLDKDEMKRIIRLTSFLSNHPIFSCLSAREKARVISRLSFLTVSDNKSLIKDGADGILDNCFVVHSGYLKVSKDKKSFNLSTNDFFYPSSESSSIDDLSVEVKQSGGILSIKKEDFKDLILDKFSDSSFLQNI